ncbi:MAG TPA: aldehyde dehydrogenase family protein, partial [Phaeodactylibacter sp.]|nr:aldehyde dehydrogenase family protein [Phaeodactylibacter sp.]
MNNTTLRDSSLFKTQCLIDGKWVDSELNKSIKVTNPFNAELLAEIPELSIRQVNQAIQSASEAFLQW